MITGGHALLAQDTLTGPANFVVTSDAQWDAVFAGSAQSLRNKIIDIAAPPSAFTQRSINDKDMLAVGGRLTIRSANPACGLPSIILNGTVRGIDFAGLNFQMTGWPKHLWIMFRLQQRHLRQAAFPARHQLPPRLGPRWQISTLLRSFRNTTASTMSEPPPRPSPSMF